MKTLNLHVSGMTCSSCEVLIERNLQKVEGVQKIQIDRAKEEAVVECAENVTLENLQKALDQKYHLSVREGGSPVSEINGDAPANKKKRRYLEIGAVLLIILGFYVMLRQLDFLPKSIGITENMSYGLIFVMGLIAATSTCLAVSGGLLLSVAAKFNEKYPHLSGWQRFKPHIYFNVGRVISYTLLGGAAGALGSVLSFTPQITGIITIGISILMIIIGLQLLQIFPWLNKIQLKMPKFIAHKLYDSSQEYNGSKVSSFFFGAATFFLPCGFTQALQLYVLGKGDFVTGALTMLAFSLGTLPGLAGIGAFSSFAKGNLQRHFMTFSAVLVIVFGVVSIPAGFNLTGAVIGIPDGQVVMPEPPITENGKQVIQMEVAGLKYNPSTFVLTEGVPVEWQVDGRKAQGCAQVLSVPALGITEYLPKNEIKTIKFTPEKAGTIRFSCSMGMAGPGSFTVQKRGDKV